MTGLHGLNKYSRLVAGGTGTFKRFQWVLPGKLARSTQPNYGSGDAEHTLTPDDIKWLRDNKIACLISANHCKMKDEAKKLLGNAGIAFFHFKVEDFQPPKKQQLVKASSVIELFGRRGATLVYCGYGQGRTGTFVAAWAMIRYLRERGVNTDDMCTLNKLKDNFGVETKEQASVIREAAGLGPLPATTGAAPIGLPSPGMGLPLPSSAGSWKPPFVSGGSFTGPPPSSAGSWVPPKMSSPSIGGLGAKFSSGSTWAPPPLPTSPAALGSGSGPNALGFPDEDNLTEVLSGKWKDLEF